MTDTLAQKRYKLGVKVSGAIDWTAITQQATGGNNAKLQNADIVIGELGGTVRVLKHREGRVGTITPKRSRDLLAECETVHRFRV